MCRPTTDVERMKEGTEFAGADMRKGSEFKKKHFGKFFHEIIWQGFVSKLCVSEFPLPARFKWTITLCTNFCSFFSFLWFFLFIVIFFHLGNVMNLLEHCCWR